MKEHILLSLIQIFFLLIVINIPHFLFFKIIYAEHNAEHKYAKYILGRPHLSDTNNVLTFQIQRIFSNSNLDDSCRLNQLEQIGRENNLYIRFRVINTVMNQLRSLEQDRLLLSYPVSYRSLIREIINFIYNRPYRNFNNIRNIIINSRHIPDILTRNDTYFRYDIFGIGFGGNIDLNLNRNRLNRYIFYIMSDLIRFDRINYSAFYPNQDQNTRYDFQRFIRNNYNRISFLNRNLLRDIAFYAEESIIEDSNEEATIRILLTSIFNYVRIHREMILTIIICIVFFIISSILVRVLFFNGSSDNTNSNNIPLFIAIIIQLFFLAASIIFHFLYPFYI